MTYELSEGFSFEHATIQIDNPVGSKPPRLPRKEKKRLKLAVFGTYKELAARFRRPIPKKAPKLHYKII